MEYVTLEGRLPKNVELAINSDERVKALNKYGSAEIILDPHLSSITEMVCDDLEVASAMINFVDEKSQRSVACVGLQLDTCGVEESFCAHTIADNADITVILDADHDPRFADLPSVIGDQQIKFYAGVPLIVGGQRIGALCAIDHKARQGFDNKKKSRLIKLGNLITSFMTLKFDSIEKSKVEQQRDSEMRRHQLSVKASRVVSWVWHVEEGIIECDDEMREMFAITHKDEISPNELFDLIHPDDVEDVKERVQNTLLGKVDYESEYRIKKTGRWVNSQGAVLDRSSIGLPTKVAGVNLDITDRRNSEEKTRLLLLELNHRVKNTLAMLQSIAAQTLKSSKSPEAFRRAFSNRINGIASAHTLLSEKEWERVGVHRLIGDQVKPYAEKPAKQIQINGENVFLDPEEALALGMVLHELATNAARFGALSKEDGVVTIELKIQQSDEGNDILAIEWSEANGPETSKPETTGFGTVMITRSLDKVIGSSVELDFCASGVKVHIKMPLSKA